MKAAQVGLEQSASPNCPNSNCPNGPNGPNGPNCPNCQVALEQSASQLGSTERDRAEKLKNAFEVAASLRAMLQQKDATLKAASSRERRQVIPWNPSACNPT